MYTKEQLDKLSERYQELEYLGKSHNVILMILSIEEGFDSIEDFQSALSDAEFSLEKIRDNIHGSNVRVRYRGSS